MQARMRTLDGCMEALKQEDPGCQLTRWALRKLVLSGRVPSVVIGTNKRLVNVDVVKTFLAGELPPPAEPEQAGKIRRVGA